MEEKLLYSYTRALSQPHLFQQYSKNGYLDHAYRLSFIFYGLGIAGLCFGVMFVMNLPMGLNFILALTAGYFGGVFLSELKPDGKVLPIFLRDYILHQARYGKKESFYYKGVRQFEGKEILKQEEFERKVVAYFENSR